jgi:hypothetical protein
MHIDIVYAPIMTKKLSFNSESGLEKTTRPGRARKGLKGTGRA